jgi:myo-inositol-1(or 4)-monophosphatase
MGSVAFKLACVAAGLADATWTQVPKHEWDVAGGVALARASGCEVRTPAGAGPAFNQADPVLAGLLACPAQLAGEVCRLLGVPHEGVVP